MRTMLVFARYVVCVGMVLPGASAAGADKSMYVIPSWGDITLVHGPGTDVAMDTERGMENTFRHWKGRGFTGVFLRTDLIHMAPGSIVRHPAKTQPNPRLAVFWHTVDEILAQCDPQMAARKAAAKVGFEHWVFHPHIYSEGAPADVGVPGVGRMVPWSYARKYHVELPEVITVDRQGNRQWMVPEYAYAGARADKVADFVHIARTYRPTGIIASMRSEASQLLPPPDHGDQYGFNQPVVDDMKRLYGVDIRTDPRFDWKSGQFKPTDSMVEKWRALRGTYLTRLYREIRQAIRSVDPKIQFGVTLSGQYAGPVLGNWMLDWRTWVDEGLVDLILVPVPFEATLDHESGKKGYLTDVRLGKGMVPAAEVSQYIAKSARPKIRVIHTGAPSYFYPPPPAGSDGWQCDVWYDVYHVAWHQRWEQWKRDLADFGHIKFFEQDFDAFPLRSTAIGGGWGDGRYHPDLRATPGVWSMLGDGSDGKAVVQDEIRRGGRGHAVLLSRDEFVGVHLSSPDRSRMTGMLDNTISNGKALLEFWIYRDNDQTGLTVLFTDDNINASYAMTGQDDRDVGLRVETGSGRVAYASGKQWKPSDMRLPPRQWHQLSIEVDADGRTYSACAGPQRKPICSGVKYAPPGERFVEQHGVNIPIKVPSYRVFNTLNFIPAGSPNNRIYLDDVAVKWIPTLHFAPAGRHVLLSETFERAEPGARLAATLFDGRWKAEPADQAEAFFIERTTSFGPGVQCLRASGGGTLTVETLRPDSSTDVVLTVDLDFFVRSDRSFPYIIPDPTTRSKHSFVLSLDGDAPGRPLAALDCAGGIWRLWDGHRFAETGKPVTYDVWNHLQIAVNSRTKTYRFVVQPLGELPTMIGDVPLSASADAKEKLKLSLRPSATAGHISCYDNLRATCD